jgi:hypothetical protein
MCWTTSICLQTPELRNGFRRLFFVAGFVFAGGVSSPLFAADFDADVAPILAKRCLSCHNGSDRKGGLDLSGKKSALAGGDSGPAIVAGKPDESLFWERVSQDEMPPKKPLPEPEKKALRDWLAGGAAWGTDPIDPFRYTSDNRAGYDWWALQPVRRPELPSVRNLTWCANDLDRFILAALEEKGLTPNGPADRRTLIRRLSFDLLGLPPTPAEVAAFVSDDSPDAYARLVDKYLDSPHYGERWGRHWLDVVRFGESQGFERDKLRPNAWPYRDWVIRAFNVDLPYDDFVCQQIAGDVLANDPLGTVATGFLVAAPWDEVGQNQQSAAMKAVVRQDELEDVIGVTSQTFLGLTVNCARCHDHKFDPVSQQDYYRLAATFAGVRHGEREPLAPRNVETTAVKRAALEPQAAALRARLEEFDGPIRNRILARKERTPPPVEKPAPVARWEFDGNLQDAVGSLHGKAHGGARLEEGRLILDGSTAFVETAPLDKPLKARTLEAVVSLANLEQRGGAAISVQTLDGSVFDAIVFGEREPLRWMAGSDGFRRSKDFEGEAEDDAAKAFVHLVIVYQADRTIVCYRNGKPYGKPYQADTLATFEPEKSQVLFGLRHSPPGGNRYLAGAIDRAALYDAALSPEQVAALAGTTYAAVSEDEILAEMSPELKRERNSLLLELSQVETELRLLSGNKIYAVSPGKPETTHLLSRGDTRLKQEVMTPGAVDCIKSVSADFRLGAESPEGLRRVKLAEWIAGPRNPLTPRVLVNRLWHYHFGSGIVETPNDFGFNGGRPSHPQLLDWLASEFVARGWSMKAIHRLLVTSSTYRMASTPDAASAKLDQDNFFLWRMNSRRLEAEAVRDNLLFVCGSLDPAMGGPEIDHNLGLSSKRRSLYLRLAAEKEVEFLKIFDGPAVTECYERRPSVMPQQALALANSELALSEARKLAKQLATDVDEAFVRAAFMQVLARRPTAEETRLGREFLTSSTPERARENFVLVLLNHNDFVTVR